MAVVTEGDGEFKALPALFDQFREANENLELIRITKLSVQPDGPVEKIKRQCEKLAPLFTAKRVDEVILVLDREQQGDAAGVVAQRIESAVAGILPMRLRVVLKDRTFENWVIADVDALATMPARFEVTPALRRAVTPNKADRVAALELIKKASRSGNYDKIQDAERVLKHARVEHIGANSRSFRHLLHILQHPLYANGCKRAVA